MTRGEKQCRGKLSTSLLDATVSSDEVGRNSDCENRTGTDMKLKDSGLVLSDLKKKKIDMEVLGLSLFPFQKIGRYVDPASRIDITECHSRLRWLQNYDIPCSPLHLDICNGSKSQKIKRSQL